VKNYPGYSFVMIGKSVRELNRFNEFKNFRYLGAVDYAELPKYASVFDVGLIPFELNEITIPANPLKLLEYFSLGIPVVSTNLPEAKKFESLALIARDKEEFIKMIREAVSDNSSERRKMRIDTAAGYSWESVTEKVFDKILDVESKKKLTDYR
jgi:glycosyltransferase involved in cell wall biosynthesis